MATTVNAVNTYIVPTTSHEITVPLQPAFFAEANQAQLNVTGNAAVYTVIFDNTHFDQNSDYNNATGVLTAPVTGKYQFNYAVSLLDLAAAHTFGQVSLVVSSGISPQGWFGNVGAMRSNGNECTLCGSVLVAMSATNTAHVAVQVSNGALVVDIDNSANEATHFSGFLVC